MSGRTGRSPVCAAWSLVVNSVGPSSRSMSQDCVCVTFLCLTGTSDTHSLLLCLVLLFTVVAPALDITPPPLCPSSHHDFSPSSLPFCSLVPLPLFSIFLHFSFFFCFVILFFTLQFSTLSCLIVCFLNISNKELGKTTEEANYSLHFFFFCWIQIFVSPSCSGHCLLCVMACVCHR